MEDGKAANDESKTKTLEIGSTGEVLPAVNADLVGTQQHLFRKREQIQQDEHLKDGTWGQYDNGQGVSLLDSSRRGHHGRGRNHLGLFEPIMPAVLPPVMEPAIVAPVVAPAVMPPVVPPVMGMGGMTPPILPPFTR